MFERVLGLIFPPKCIFCGSLMDAGADLHICGACYKKIPFVAANPLRLSGRCEAGVCDGAVSVFRYTGMVKHSLIRYKFYNRPGYYRTFARLLAKFILKVTNPTKFDMIISVPLHKTREFKRGYNQALLVAKALSREIGVRECSALLVRTRHTAAQSLLDRKSRLKNVKGAFSVTDAEKIRGKGILLVDDILTTGATINECGSILKEAGAKSVMVAVVATGQEL